MQKLSKYDSMALGLMTLALSLGAGNIIYSPFVGQITDSYYVSSAIGFKISGVLLPMLAMVVLAKKKEIRLRSAPLWVSSGVQCWRRVFIFFWVFFCKPTYSNCFL